MKVSFANVPFFISQAILILIVNITFFIVFNYINAGIIKKDLKNKATREKGTKVDKIARGLPPILPTWVPREWKVTRK